MTGQQREMIRIVRDVNEDWLLDWHSGTESQAAADLCGRLEEAAQAYQRRFPICGPFLSLSVENVVKESEVNTQRVKAFLQALGASSNPDMLAMVWRVLHGSTIQRVRLEHEHSERFLLEVTVHDEHMPSEEVFTSYDIHEAALLRHFGILIMDDKPVFDGFYPLK